VSLDPTDGAVDVTVLTAGFVAAGRPDLSFDGRRILFVGKRDPDDPLNVWEMDVDGRHPRQVTRRTVDCTRAIYLPPIYTSASEGPVHQLGFISSNAGGVVSLFTCRMDGSGVRRITYNPLGVRDPYLLDDGRLLYRSWQSAGHESRGGGPPPRKSTLFTVNTDGTDVSAFAGADEPPAFRTMPVDPAGRYHSPSSLPDGRLLVSYRAEGDGTYGIHVFDAARDSRTEVFDSPRWHEVNARLVRARHEPPGRSSVIDERLAHGYLYGLDAYLSNTTAGASIERGEIERVQIFAAIVDVDDEREETHREVITEVLLGEAPVESDGSFHLEIPARTPLRLRTVDAGGRTLQSMRSWIWVMPREARGCIGCHEDRELTPPNRHVLALRKPSHVIGVPARDEPYPTGEDRRRE